MTKTQIIDIKSELFSPALEGLDRHIKHILSEIKKENFEEGTVTLKIDISTSDEELNIGDTYYEYLKPKIQFAVNSSLKKTYKESETFDFKDCELKLLDGKYVIEKIDDGQVNMLKELNR